MPKQIENEQNPSDRQRKSTIWTKNKIAHLIQQYRQNECLWNYFSHYYRCKKEREKAISSICKELNITKFEFGKKIHNLRNQFNTENKKLERRIEEAGGSAVDINVSQSCRWEHFESLIFLKDVIEPRPGGFQGGTPHRKMLIKSECADRTKSNKENSMEWTPGYSFDETITGDDTFTTQTDQEELINQNEADKKYSSSESASKNAEELTFTTLPIETDLKKTYYTIQHIQKTPTCKTNQHNSKQIQQEIIINGSTEQTEHIPTGSVIELPTSISTTAHSQDEQLNITTNIENKKINDSTTTTRDQWDAFGELIATECRNLNSDISRRKLKRKIMQAMVEIGEEDDLNSS